MSRMRGEKWVERPGEKVGACPESREYIRVRVGQITSRMWLQSRQNAHCLSK